MDSASEEWIVNVENRNFIFKVKTEADLSTKMLLSVEEWE